MIFVIDVVFENFSHSVPALKGSYGSCKGRCLMRVLTLGHRIFPLNFRKNGFCQILTRVLGRPISPANFHMKWLLCLLAGTVFGWVRRTNLRSLPQRRRRESKAVQRGRPRRKSWPRMGAFVDKDAWRKKVNVLATDWIYIYINIFIYIYIYRGRPDGKPVPVAKGFTVFQQQRVARTRMKIKWLFTATCASLSGSFPF